MTTDKKQKFILECFKRVNPNPVWKTSKPNENSEECKKYIVVKCDDDELKLVHYACDKSGEEQPAFEGWFYWTGNYFASIFNINKWYSCPDYCEYYFSQDSIDALHNLLITVVSTLQGNELSLYLRLCNNINGKITYEECMLAAKTKYIEQIINSLCTVFNISE